MALSSRNAKASDTFDASISADWENGGGDWDPMTWASGGYVGHSATGVDCMMRRQTESFGNNQYAKTVLNALTAGASQANASVRMQAGTDESSYFGCMLARSGGDLQYFIFETSASFGFTVLAEGGSAPSSYTAGDYLVMEASGTSLELYSKEGAGAETSRLTATDATIASGKPGCGAYADSGTVQITSWEGGDDVAAGGANPKGPLGNPFAGPFGGPI